MMNIQSIAISFLGAALSAPLGYPPDLSKYRDFRFGDSLAVIAKLVHLKPSEAKTIHQRPALIQELTWQRTTLPQGDPVKNMVFSFYRDALYRVVITYDAERTEGLTVEDIIEAISKQYGTVTRPVAEITLTTTYLYNDGEKSISEQHEKVIARWEDARYSYNLFQPYPQSPFGMAIYEKAQQTQAEAAIVEALRLEEEEAPVRTLTRQKQKEAEERLQQGKARQANKQPFRP
ncbi:MAG: hypothetical protein JST84_21610 [Acidobacteria bacterium]|nr:hypothetical protein [Acidobacteriota bacterium]